MNVTKVDDRHRQDYLAQPERPVHAWCWPRPTSGPDDRHAGQYAKQFHKNYQDPAKLDALVKQNKVDDWVKLFQTKVTGVPGTPINGRWTNERPAVDLCLGPDRTIRHQGPHHGRSQPLLLEGRHRRATSSPISTTSTTTTFEDIQVLALKAASRRDRHDGPPLQHHRQQAGLR